MIGEKHITPQEARRLKNDTAFLQLVENVREQQKDVFVNSAAHDVEQREEAHAIVRALNWIDVHLDAVITAETLQLRKGN